MEQDRRKAAEKGEAWYFTGKPCKRGHLARRQVANGGCDECMHPGRGDARERSMMRSLMKRARFIVANRNREFFESVLFGLARSKSDGLLTKDILTRRKPDAVSLDSTLREYRVFSDHEDFLRELEKTLR